MLSEGLEQFVIYERPKDHPNGYVVKRWHIVDGLIWADTAAERFDTLEEARSAIPDGMFRMQRNEKDDPAILEVWL